MASFKSLLSDVGHGLKWFFEHIIPGAVAAEPLVDAVFPGVGQLFNVVVNAVAGAEGIAIAAGKQSGTGTQKLALVLGDPNFQAEIASIEKTLGVTVDQSKQTEIVNAIVALLNAIPASNTSTNPTSSTPVSHEVPAPSGTTTTVAL